MSRVMTWWDFTDIEGPLDLWVLGWYVKVSSPTGRAGRHLDHLSAAAPSEDNVKAESL